MAELSQSRHGHLMVLQDRLPAILLAPDPDSLALTQEGFGEIVLEPGADLVLIEALNVLRAGRRNG